MSEINQKNIMGTQAAGVLPAMSINERDRLVHDGYWPALASKLLNIKAYSKVIALCQENLDENNSSWSGRIIYALALHHSGQLEASEKQFQQVLSWDPDNLVALKYLGDIRNNQNDHFGAMSHYQRILEIDPDCQGVQTDLKSREKTTTKTISLKRPREEIKNRNSSEPGIKFYTETMGNLYLTQGHSRLAARVFKRLLENDNNPKWQDKLDQAEKKQQINRTGN